MRLNNLVSPIFILLVALCCYGDTVTTYRDQSAFLTAAQAIPNTTTETETFGSSTITAPDLSVQTISGIGSPSPGYGRIANGAWQDCVGRPCEDPATGTPYYYDSTLWKFAKPIYAFGATFDYDSEQGLAPGLTFGTYVDSIFAPIADGFFGFISDVPFDSVTVNFGPGQTGDVKEQRYSMGPLTYQEDPPASAPEPCTVGLFALGAIGLLITIRRAMA